MAKVLILISGASGKPMMTNKDWSCLRTSSVFKISLKFCNSCKFGEDLFYGINLNLNKYVLENFSAFLGKAPRV